jgi:cellulose synthase/poly-beta-1,6-N-acetylglucosamine synthase-like glycosyltransferase
MHGVAEIVFFLSVTFVAYTLAGYPIALALTALLHFRPVVRRYEPKTVTILLPVRNGERWLCKKLESLFALRYPPELVQILVISDGSTDSTDDLARQYAACRRIEFLRVAGGGKAVALNAGLERAEGEILFLTDVRQQLDPDSLKNLVACFADPSVGVASGELMIREGRTHEEASVGLYWRYEKWLRKRESRIHSVMGATGCIYAIRRALATSFPPGTLVDDMFLPLAAFFKGYRVIVEESARAFDYPTALETEFRRKVRTQAGVYQIMGLFPRLLTPRNRMWLAFLSHKLARLLMPFALLLAAAASFGLSQPSRAIAVSAQAVFYGVAVLDLWIPDRFTFKGISAAIRGFTVLMAAAFCAALLLLRPSENLWKETTVRVAEPPADA